LLFRIFFIIRALFASLKSNTDETAQNNEKTYSVNVSWS
jgi:hypothetical protein